MGKTEKEHFDHERHQEPYRGSKDEKEKFSLAGHLNQQPSQSRLLLLERPSKRMSHV